MGIEQVQQLFQSSEASGSKSNIIRPILWMFSILLTGIVAASLYGLPTPIIYTLLVMLGLVFCAILITYGYCVFKHPDYLRSEKFNIHKMAMEKGYYGDNATGGLIEKPSNLTQIESQAKSITSNEN